MDSIDDHIISILRSNTKNLEKDYLSFKFSTGAWESITDQFKLLKFPDYFYSDFPLKELGTPLHKAPIAFINDKYKGVMINGLYYLEFDNLYGLVILELLKSPDIKKSQEARIFIYLTENRGKLKATLSKMDYLVLKLWLNYFYGMLNKMPLGITMEDVSTRALIVSEKIKSLADEWFYVETDSLYFRTSDIMGFNKKSGALGYPFEIKEIESAIFFAKKKYLVGSINNIKGFKIY